MSKKNILFINGVPDNHKVKVRKIQKDGSVSWGGSGSANVSNYLKNDLFDISDLIFDTNRDQKLPRKMIHAVFNQISDPDSHKIALKKADDFYKAVSGNIPFFNAPSNVMKTTRDNIYRSLQGIDKLHVPKTVKLQPRSPSDIYDIIEKEDFEFPVIFRQAGDHGGISTILIENNSEQFYDFPLDERDYYLTQFVDCAYKGVYTKYRLIVIDGEVFMRHAIFSKNWMVHGGAQLKNEVSNTNKQFIADRFTKEIKPLIQPIVTEIYHLLGLDYFGIDCDIDNEMNMLVFEVNVNMRIFALTDAKNNIFVDHIERARQALIKMLSSKKL